MHDDEREETLESATNFVKEQLTLLWRRERASSFQLAQTAHPTLDANSYGTLNLLAQKGPSSLDSIIEMLGIEKSGVSKHLNKLQASGLVSRRSDRSQPSSHIVFISDEGRQQLVTARRARARVLKEFLSGAEGIKPADFTPLLTRLNMTLNQAD